MNITNFRNGIFALRTRRFGSVAEIMVKKLYNLKPSTTLLYDLFDPVDKKRIEVKFSTVSENSIRKINESNVIDECVRANAERRILSLADASRRRFNCNIQQIKCRAFDVLYYGLFFFDKILIFKMTAEQVKNCPGYSDKMHRGNKGEGQFHIENKNFVMHCENYFERELSYQELYCLLK